MAAANISVVVKSDNFFLTPLFSHKYALNNPQHSESDKFGEKFARIVPWEGTCRILASTRIPFKFLSSYRLCALTLPYSGSG